mmetsp:Transcript_23462/g.37555  ORF Transcript_23462/g.37555 Transcript_23462/m.37555 type:complete len:251 (-) Transcript_23462:214-966(-)
MHKRRDWCNRRRKRRGHRHTRRVECRLATQVSQLLFVDAHFAEYFRRQRANALRGFDTQCRSQSLHIIAYTFPDPIRRVFAGFEKYEIGDGRLKKRKRVRVHQNLQLIHELVAGASDECLSQNRYVVARVRDVVMQDEFVDALFLRHRHRSATQQAQRHFGGGHAVNHLLAILVDRLRQIAALGAHNEALNVVTPCGVNERQRRRGALVLGKLGRPRRHLFEVLAIRLLGVLVGRLSAHKRVLDHVANHA